MKSIIIAGVVISTICMPIIANAESYTLQPIASNGQSVRYDHGLAFVSSNLAESGVTVTPLPPELHSTISLLITFYNKGGQSFNVDPSNIHIVTARGKAVKIYSYDDLVGRVKRAAGWKSLAVGIAGGLQTYANAQPITVSTTGTATAYSGGYMATGFYNSTTQIYNSPATQIANMENARETSAALDAINTNAAMTAESLGSRILQRTTIDSNQALTGQLIADVGGLSSQDLSDLTVTIQLGNEIHTLNFTSNRTNLSLSATRTPAATQMMNGATMPLPIGMAAQVSDATPIVVNGVTYTPYVPKP